VDGLKTACREVMVFHSIAIQEALDRDPSGVLHRSLAKIVHGLPPQDQLTWVQWKPDGVNVAAGCFSGTLISKDNVDGDEANRRVIVTIHVDLLLTGTLLVNGFPLGGLPNRVKRHALYKRVFGGRDFEVVTTADGISKTSRPTEGAMYDFVFVGERLRIREISESNKTVLTLLDDVAKTDFNKSVPSRLSQLHSHWHAQQQCGDDKEAVDVVLFRGVAYSNRAVTYIRIGKDIFDVPPYQSNHEMPQLVTAAVRKGECDDLSSARTLSWVTRWVNSIRLH
jgi:hypothetical protein